MNAAHERTSTERDPARSRAGWSTAHTRATVTDDEEAPSLAPLLCTSPLPTTRLRRKRYSTLGTPSAVLIRPDGRMGSPVAAGADAIKALVARAAAREPDAKTAARANGQLPVGAPAPPVRLPDLSGTPVELAGFRGHDTVVLFWNTGCGFCQRMLPDLKAWGETAASGKPKLLVVSTGAAEANRAMGLTTPVVLDPDFSVGRAFGAGGTPSAVLVDADGRIASPVAVGAPAVLALAAPLEVASAAR